MNGAGLGRPAMHMRNRWYAGVAAAAGVALSFALLPGPAAAFAALLAVVAIVIVIADIERLIIPDIANLTMFVLGIAFVLTESGAADAPAAGGDAVLRSAVAGGSLYLLRFGYRKATGIAGLGLGDVKLAAAGAPFLAWPTLPLALALAAAAGIMAAVASAILGGTAVDRKTELPFGAFLAPSLWLSLIFERNGLLS